MGDDIDKIIDNALITPLTSSVPISEQSIVNQDRERLISIVAGGNSKEYLGKTLTTSEVENLSDKEFTKLYARYEAYLGGLITKSLKEQLCSAYVKGIELLCPAVSKGHVQLEYRDELVESLNIDPIINLAVSKYTCKLYHEYGHFLAPITAALLTSTHLSYQEPLPLILKVPTFKVDNKLPRNDDI